MEKSIKHFIENINRVLYLDSMAEYDREELVTTLALVVIEGDRLYGANVGDSRIYLHRNIDGDTKLTQLSEDHTMDEEGMENVLMAAMGLEENVSPYYFENNLLAGDLILLCSDGLYNELSEDELRSDMKMGASFLVKKASKLHDADLPDRPCVPGHRRPHTDGTHQGHDHRLGGNPGRRRAGRLGKTPAQRPSGGRKQGPLGLSP